MSGRSPSYSSITLLPNGEGFTDYRSFTYAGAADIVSAVNDSSDSSYAYRSGGVFNDRQSWTLDPVPGNIPPQSLVTQVVISVRVVGVSAPRDVTVSLGGDSTAALPGLTDPVVVSTDPYTITYDVTNIAPVGGFPWTVDKINSTCIVISTGYENTHIAKVQLDVTFDVAATQFSVLNAQQLASLRLRALRKMQRQVTIETGMLWPLDIELLDRFHVSTDAVDSVDGKGWGVKSWQRGLLALLSSDFDLQNLKLTLHGYDLQDYICSLWSTFATEVSPGYLQKGSAFMADYDRLNGGDPLTFSRSTFGYIEHPTDTSRVLFVPNATPKLNSKGILVEQSVAQIVKHSAFDTGLTGWTTSGTGSGGSDIVTNSNTNMPSYITQTGIKFTQGSPAVNLQVLSAVTDSLSANTEVIVTVDHQDNDASKPLYWSLWRTTGTSWWNDSTSTWGGAQVWNAMTGSTGWARHISKKINIGGSASTLQLVVGIPSTGSASQVNYCSHAEIQVAQYALSRVVATTATYTTAADVPHYALDSTYGRMWPSGNVSGCCQIYPLWSTSELPASAQRTVINPKIDANNLIWIYYDQATSSFKFTAVIGGVSNTVTKSFTVTKNTKYKIAWRITGSAGELGLTAYTMDLWIDSVKAASSAVAAGELTGTGDIYLGCTNLGSQLDGYVSDLLLTPIVYCDEKMEQLPQ